MLGVSFTMTGNARNFDDPARDLLDEFGILADGRPHAALRHPVRAAEVQFETVDGTACTAFDEIVPACAMHLGHQRRDDRAIGIRRLALRDLAQVHVERAIGDQLDVVHARSSCGADVEPGEARGDVDDRVAERLPHRRRPSRPRTRASPGSRCSSAAPMRAKTDWGCGCRRDRLERSAISRSRAAARRCLPRRLAALRGFDHHRVARAGRNMQSPAAKTPDRSCASRRRPRRCRARARRRTHRAARRTSIGRSPDHVVDRHDVFGARDRPRRPAGSVRINSSPVTGRPSVMMRCGSTLKRNSTPSPWRTRSRSRRPSSAPVRADSTSSPTRAEALRDGRRIDRGVAAADDRDRVAETRHDAVLLRVADEVERIPTPSASSPGMPIFGTSPMPHAITTAS
jgi:hypothetical protein